MLRKALQKQAQRPRPQEVILKKPEGEEEGLAGEEGAAPEQDDKVKKTSQTAPCLFSVRKCNNHQEGFCFSLSREHANTLKMNDSFLKVITNRFPLT